MKSLTMNLMVAAAALMAAAGSASAQVVRVEVPFAFQAHGVNLAPGTYNVSLSHPNGSQVLRIFNQDTKASVLTMLHNGKDAPKHWLAAGNPVFSFACADGRCELQAIWLGEGTVSLAVPTPKNRSNFASAEIINLRGVKAD